MVINIIYEDVVKSLTPYVVVDLGYCTILIRTYTNQL